ncbi:DUF1707 domain-containing protein [Saccharopolyspora sp. NPDC047091]|uniref:DUF1707 SHOCT-like domain-containing protein n=1 Tax=Saccharopolyspora sp. NPDC047091 TaxID=3155924 RepID=UPI0033D6186A
MSAVTHADLPARDGDIRLSDADRAQGMRLLNEHVAAGCLTSEEFGDRAVQLEQARTRAELLVPFHDLPQPRPRFGDVVPAQRGTPPPTALPAAEPTRPTPHLRYLITAVGAPCAIVGAITGLAAAASEPSLLVLATLVVLGLYLVLLVAGHLSAR